MKILCVGKNYLKHAAELGDPAPVAPLWFWIPDSAIIHDGQMIRLPTGIGEIHHEVELAVRIGEHAQAVDAFTVAIDVTARDMQRKAKEAGHPWTQAKGYDTFLPLGEWVDAVGIDLQNLHLRLTVNGEVRQDGHTRDMMWPVTQLLQAAQQWVTLKPGDVLLTGTPEGVGPIRDGDEILAEVVDHARLQVTAKEG